MQPTPFVGREKELGEVLALLRAPSTRLLTLTGAGGSGKTRLAVQAAAEVVDDFEHGVWWVPLQAVRDPARVGAAIGSALGAREELAGHIGSKRMLLVLDNFEQVAEAAPELGELLAACPGLRLLVTSRELLRLAAEREYSVPPLVEQESVGFFLSRARAARPGFEPDEHVLAICRRLDHLPLALELAAARVKALSTAQILERLEHALPLLTGGARDLPERQRTLARRDRLELRAAHRRTEQEAFRRLGIFSGGWTLEAAEQVAGAELDTLAVARREEPGALRRGALLPPGDDPRVRVRTAGRGRASSRRRAAGTSTSIWLSRRPRTPRQKRATATARPSSCATRKTSAPPSSGP